MVVENEEKKILRLDIEDGPPELDFLFALARGEKLMLTLRTRGVSKGMEVYIDGLTNRSNREYWAVEGRFWERDRRSNFLFKKDEERKQQSWYVVWGEFKATYNKRTRKGMLVTKNFKVEHVNIT